jgi:hypothetical protein
VIREDKKVKDLLYAGSERGFYISYNGGTELEQNATEFSGGAGY